tara:strand:+ start:1013 stop:2893 length:1881 start_codon:yes stop_codon:yes gene_type:complete
MANGEELNSLQSSAENIKVVFAEISNLVNELNSNLSQTVDLTSKIQNNQAQSSDESKKATADEKAKAELMARAVSLKKSELKQLQEGLKSGKGLNKELAAKLGLEGKADTLAGTAAMMKAKALGLTNDSLKAEKERIKEAVKRNALELGYNALASAGNQILDVFVQQMMAADQETTNLGKSLNISKGEAIALKQEFAKAAINAEDIAINSVRIAKANSALNEQLGTAFVFASDTLTTFSKLTEIVGLSAEAAGSLAFQAERSGTSFREVEENTLAASFNLQRQAGVALDLKGVLEATGKVTGQVRANLGANPEAIAKAVTAAKLFGAEIDDIVASSKALLSFESSIESELEAELLTGKQLNLERARALSLAGDQEGLAKELTAQAGNFSEFTKLNVIQQDKLAQAFGMSSDKLSDILFKQETQGMNAKQLRAQGKEELADKLEQLSTQDKINLAQEKLATILGDISTLVLPIVEGFGRFVGFIMESKLALAGLVGIMTALAVVSIASSIANIMSSFGMVPFGIGVPLGIAAVAGLLAMIGTGIAMVGDGIAPSSQGPFTIMDNYGGMAKTTPGDNLQVGPGVGKGSNSSTPIVIQNSISPFAMANSGKPRRGLGGIQELQASPTMA